MSYIYEKIKTNPEILKDLPEGQNIEYKTLFWWEEDKRDWQRECAKDLSAMCNGGGGVIIVGIRDNGEIREILGINRDENLDKIKKRIIQTIFNYIEPKIEVNIDIIKTEEREICIIGIPDWKQYGPVGLINKEKNHQLEFWIRRISHTTSISYNEVRMMFYECFRGSLYRKNFLKENIEYIQRAYPQRPLLILQAIPYYFDEDKDIFGGVSEIKKHCEEFRNEHCPEGLVKLSGEGPYNIFIGPKKPEFVIIFDSIDVISKIKGIMIELIKTKNSGLILIGITEIDLNGYLNSFFFGDFFEKRGTEDIIDPKKLEKAVQFFINLLYKFYSKANIKDVLFSFTIIPDKNNALMFNTKFPSPIFLYEDYPRYLNFRERISIEKETVVNELLENIWNMFGLLRPASY